MSSVVTRHTRSASASPPVGKAAAIASVGGQRGYADWTNPDHRLRWLLSEFIGMAGLTFVPPRTLCCDSAHFAALKLQKCEDHSAVAQIGTTGSAIAPPVTTGAARRALFERLARAARVTEVSAPAGYGKTFLLRSWNREEGLVHRAGCGIGTPMHNHPGDARLQSSRRL